MTSLPSRRLSSLALMLAAVALGNGCAAVSNPISDGIPVRYLPKEVLGRSKKELIQVPLQYLRLQESSEYKLDKNDMLAVIAGDMFGPEGVQPPVTTHDPATGQVSSVGYPVPVREDGTIAFPTPKLKPMNVKGLTIAEAEEKLRRVLLEGEDNVDANGKPIILFAPGSKISLQLMRKRRYSVTVVRDDIQTNQTTGNGGIAVTQQKRFGVPVSLEAGKNDLLSALNASGGPPGSDARELVIIERAITKGNTVRRIEQMVPLSVYYDQPINITPEDITLNEGDIIRIPNRNTELYLVGGVINPRQVALPRDYDLDVVQAIIVGNGPIISGAFQNNQFQGNQVNAGIGQPSPALVNVLRQLPDGQQLNIRVDLDRALKDPRENILILANDRIIMQEKPAEAMARYLYQTFRTNFFASILRTPTSNANVNGTLP
jgi:hypothetical protein